MKTERKDVWSRVDALNAAHNYGSGAEGFTVREYSERYRLSLDGAGGRLNKLERAGQLVSSWALRAGSRVKVFRFPDDK